MALYGAAMVVFSDMYLPQPILPLLSHEFGVTPAVAGFTVSTVVLLMALASTAYDPLSDVFGRKPVMVGTCVLLAAPTLLYTMAPSLARCWLFERSRGCASPA